MFMIVALDGRRWKFEVADLKDAEEWVVAIEREIHNSLNRNLSAGAKNNISLVDSKKYAGITAADRTRIAVRCLCAHACMRACACACVCVCVRVASVCFACIFILLGIFVYALSARAGIDVMVHVGEFLYYF